MREKLIKVSAFTLLGVVLLLPMFLNNEIVDTIRASTDMEAHLSVVTGESNNILYSGQYILKYLLYPYADKEYLDIVYIVFNFVMLIAVTITLYYIVRRLVNDKASYIVIPMVLFVATGIFALFKYGVIFSIINMYLILPFGVYFLIRWFTGKHWWNGALAGVLFILFSLFHVTGYYLPVFIAVSLFGYLIIGLLTHKWWQWQKVVAIACISFIFLPFIGKDIIQSQGFDIKALKLLYMHLSAIGLVLLGFGIYGIYRHYKEMRTETKMFLYIYLCMAVSLCGGLAFMATEEFNRIAIDLASTLAILSACMIGYAWDKNRVLYQGIVYLFIFIGSLPNIIAWVKV